MRRRTMTRGGLVLLATATVALSGCTDERDSTDARSTSPARSPAAELNHAAARLQTDTYTMTMTMVVDGERGQLVASMDPGKKIGTFRITVPRKDSPGNLVTEGRVIGETLYMRSPSGLDSLPGNKAAPWRRINQAADTGPAWYDGAQMASALQQATTVRRTGDNTFEGTLDLTASAKAIGVPAPKASSGAARLIAFQARVDDGRLVRYSLDTPTRDGTPNKATIVYSNFGVPVTVQPPPADQIRGD